MTTIRTMPHGAWTTEIHQSGRAYTVRTFTGDLDLREPTPCESYEEAYRVAIDQMMEVNPYGSFDDD